MMGVFMPYVWRALRVVLIVPVVVTVMMVAWLLSTKEGTQFIANIAENQLTALTLEGVDGYILGELSVARLQWSQDTVKVSANHVKTQWNPLCLLSLNICLDPLIADELTVSLLPSAEDEAPTTDADDGLPPIEMPVGIIADHVDINVFQLSLSGQGHPVSGLQFSGQWVDSLLSLSHVAGSYQGIKLNGAGTMDFSTPWISQFSGRVAYDLPDNISQYPLSFDFGLTGEALSFDIQGELRGEWPARLSSSLSFDDPRIPLTLTFDSPVAWMLPLGGENKSATTQVDINQLNVNVSLRDLTVKATSTLTTEFWSELDLALNGQWQEDRIAINQLELNSSHGGVSLHGYLGLTPQWPLDVKLSTRQLALQTAMLPPSDTPLLPYPVVIDSDWHIWGDVDGDGPDVTFNLRQLEGVVDQYPIAVNTVFNYQRDKAGGILRIDDLLVSSGVNQLSARGALSAAGDRFDNLEVHFSLSEPQQWLKELSGSLEGAISINGLIDALDVHGKLASEAIAYKDLTVGSVETEFDIAQSGKLVSSLALSVENVSIGNTHIANTDWLLNGDRDGSSVQGSVALQDKGTAAVDCDVSWDVTIKTDGANAPVKGQVDSTCGLVSWQSQDFPYSLFTPTNKESVSFSWVIDENAIEVKPFCLADEGVEICNHQTARWHPTEGYSAWLSTSELPLQQWLDRWNQEADASKRVEQLALKGLMNGDVKISQIPGQTVDANVSLTIPNLDVWLGRHPPQQAIDESKEPETVSETEPLHLAFSPLTFNAELQNENISTQLYVSSPQLGETQGQLTIRDIVKQRQLGGDVNLDQLNLSFLQDILPSVEHLSGLFSSHVEVSGTLKKPQLTGRFNLSEGVFKSGYLPETVDQISVNGQFSQYQLRYDGGFSSQGGRAILKGQLDWQNEWLLNTSISSEAFDITPRSGVSLTVKPDVTLLLSEGFADLSGTFEIPHARIKIDELPESATSVSTDARIIGNDADAVDSPWRYKAKIAIVLGNDVHFRGFGVNTYLTGQLLLRQQSKGELKGKGEINTDNGFYTLFGQRLTIKEGRFIFNGPLERPDLQLDATRVILSSSVNVGVKVTGPANEPEIFFYSQPAMNETSIIHYLLTGRAPDQKTNNADLLNNMMLSAGLFGSAELTEKWANKVGVTDLQISTQSDEEGTNLEVSGYISPDIYIKYGASLYDEAKTVTMRYRLRPNLFLEAAGGLNSSLDIIYSFEHR